MKTRAEVLAILLENGNRPDVARMYASAYCEFFEAEANIEKNGAVCANPRTGAPIDNPYLKVRDRARAALQKMRGVKTDGLWETLADRGEGRGARRKKNRERDESNRESRGKSQEPEKATDDGQRTTDE